jgi:rfaE bifunctional protein kinase chain/domain
MSIQQDIQRVREKAKGIKAMVIGDAMLDRYIYGSVDRISPEAPVPVLSYQSTEIKAGGSANVALNLAAWGCQTSIIALTGMDSNADHLTQLLDDHKIDHFIIQNEHRPTTVKTRVVAASHHLLRIDEESTQYLDGEEEVKVISYIMEVISRIKPDLIVIEDYNKGLLTDKVISSIITAGKSLNAFIAVDPKDKNFHSYIGVDLFKPNLREASRAAQLALQIGDLNEVSAGWQKSMKINTVAITLGGNGIYLHDAQQEYHSPPHKAIDVVDVCGAGDAVICVLALGILSGLGIKTIGLLANIAGSYVCSHSGVVAVDVAAIDDWI